MKRVAWFLGFAIPAFLVGVAVWDWLGLRTWAVELATTFFVETITRSLT